MLVKGTEGTEDQMKKPLLFKFIAGWFCIGLLFQFSGLSRGIELTRKAGQPVPEWWTFLLFAGFAFLVWQTGGLVSLKSFYRWFAVVFFIAWSVTLIWRAPGLLSLPQAKPVRVAIFLSAIVAFNLASAWYLSRRSFREFATQYVAEQIKEKNTLAMQRIAQKKVERGD